MKTRQNIRLYGVLALQDAFWPMALPTPPEEPSGFKKIIQLVYDIARSLVSPLDASDKAWKWIKKEAKGMRAGWHLFVVLMVILLVAAVWLTIWITPKIAAYGKLAANFGITNQLARADIFTNNIQPPPTPSIAFYQSNTTPNIDSSTQLVTIAPTKYSDKEQKIAARRAAAKIKQDEIDKIKAVKPSLWPKALPVYKKMMQSFYYIMSSKAKEHNNDTLILTSNFVERIPDRIADEIGDMDIATIGFTNLTKVKFKIDISARDQDGLRLVRITCTAGYILLRPDDAKNLYIEITMPPDISEKTPMPYDEAIPRIEQILDDLISNQIVDSTQ